MERVVGHSDDVHRLIDDVFVNRDVDATFVNVVDARDLLPNSGPPILG